MRPHVKAHYQQSRELVVRGLTSQWVQDLPSNTYNLIEPVLRGFGALLYQTGELVALLAMGLSLLVVSLVEVTSELYWATLYNGILDKFWNLSGENEALRQKLVEHKAYHEEVMGVCRKQWEHHLKEQLRRAKRFKDAEWGQYVQLLLKDIQHPRPLQLDIPIKREFGPFGSMLRVDRISGPSDGEPFPISKLALVS